MKIGGKVLKKEKLRKHKFEKTPLHYSLLGNGLKIDSRLEPSN
jgi:hypothetical protein